MRTIATKQDMLASIRHECGLWAALVTTVGEARMNIPVAMGAWTFKDLIAHLTAWWRRELSCLEAIRRNEPPMPHPSPAHVEVINDWIYHTNHDRPLSNLLQDADEVWQQFESAIEAMPERDLLQANRFPWHNGRALGSQLLADFVDHYHHDHEADVVTWLAHQSL